ncbi:hypothetical protein ACET3X_001589 [Alternaria dauci]|uniref:Uncharacterized protein n=1 Tax=Alternaria dauci TaxID=48095 RepID=A0ABR3UXS5_9PLEO
MEGLLESDLKVIAAFILTCWHYLEMRDLCSCIEYLDTGRRVAPRFETAALILSLLQRGWLATQDAGS